MPHVLRSCATRFAAVVLASSLAGSDVAAQAADRGLVVGAGLAAPGGELGRTQQSGQHLQVGLEQRWATHPVAVRLEGMAYQFSGEYLWAAGERVRFAQQRVFTIGASALFRLPVGPAAPYLVSGAGYAFETGQWPRRGMSLNGGVGLELPIGGLLPFVEARYHALDPFARSAERFGARRWVVPVTVGLRF